MAAIGWTIIYCALLWWGWAYFRDERWHSALWLLLIMLWCFIGGVVATMRRFRIARPQPWRKMKP